MRCCPKRVTSDRERKPVAHRRLVVGEESNLHPYCGPISGPTKQPAAMARVRGTSALLLVLLLVGTSMLAVIANRGHGPNSGKGVQHDEFRPEYNGNSLPETMGLNAFPEEDVAAEEDRPVSSTAGRRLQQSVLGCNGEVGICGTQAANSGFTAGEFVQSGGGYGAGNGIGNARSGRRGNGGGRSGRRGGRAGRKILQVLVDEGAFADGDFEIEPLGNGGVRRRGLGKGRGSRGRGGRARG